VRPGDGTTKGVGLATSGAGQPQPPGGKAPTAGVSNK